MIFGHFFSQKGPIQLGQDPLFLDHRSVLFKEKGPDTQAFFYFPIHSVSMWDLFIYLFFKYILFLTPKKYKQKDLKGWQFIDIIDISLYWGILFQLFLEYKIKLFESKLESYKHTEPKLPKCFLALCMSKS